jgi:hypothetical protein
MDDRSYEALRADTQDLRVALGVNAVQDHSTMW